MAITSPYFNLGQNTYSDFFFFFFSVCGVVSLHLLEWVVHGTKGIAFLVHAVSSTQRIHREDHEFRFLQEGLRCKK